MEYALTFDTDWAPDFILQDIAESLVTERIRSTWFVTNQTPALEYMRAHPEYFELGIHPNFFPNSDHGQSEDDVLDFCLRLVPEAVSMRTHGLYQSSPLFFKIIENTPISNDVSTYMRGVEHTKPSPLIYNGKTLNRLIYGWEDDLESEHANPVWTIEGLEQKGSDIFIFDFHPIHIALNSSDMCAYNALKKNGKKISDLKREDIALYRSQKQGAYGFLQEVIQAIKQQKRSYRIKDLV